MEPGWWWKKTKGRVTLRWHITSSKLVSARCRGWSCRHQRAADRISDDHNLSFSWSQRSVLWSPATVGSLTPHPPTNNQPTPIPPFPVSCMFFAVGVPRANVFSRTLRGTGQKADFRNKWILWKSGAGTEGFEGTRMAVSGSETWQTWFSATLGWSSQEENMSVDKRGHRSTTTHFYETNSSNLMRKRRQNKIK